MFDRGVPLKSVKDTMSPESGSVATMGDPTVALAPVFSFTPNVTFENTWAGRGQTEWIST